MKKILLFVLGFYSSVAFSQKFLDIPKLADTDVASTICAADGEAPAEVLYRSYHYRVDSNGFMYADVISRVKIYKKNDAANFLEHEIPLYDNSMGSREVLSGLKAYTFNLENGKVISTKVDSDSKFKSKENRYYTVTKFAFPNVKDGSVVEYSYSIITPFLSSTPEVYMEDEIPVRYTEFVFDTPVQLGYNINYKGFAIPKFRDVSEKSIYGAAHKLYRFGYVNLPAYKNEEFVLNNNNYKTALRAELNSSFYGNDLKRYALTWEDVRKSLYKHDDFGAQLKRQNLLKNILPEEIKNMTNDQEKASAVLRFFQNRYTYNKEDNVITDKGVKNLINTKVGNAAEINLLLTMFLREAGLDANPVVLSTVKRGLITLYNPSLEKLNFVLASYEKNGQIYLLDGTSKHTKINLVSPKALNYYGILMSEKGTKEINVVYPGTSETYLTIDAKMTPEGTFEGHFSDLDTNLYALMVNDLYNENVDNFRKDYDSRYTFSHHNMKSGLRDNDDFETSFDFNSDTFVDTIGNKLVFNPLLFLYSRNHSYQQSGVRKSPLEFITRNKKIKKVTLSLPEGYVFETIPKSKIFRTDDNLIHYAYKIEKKAENQLIVEASISIDDAVFPKEYYPAFTQVFDNITKLESQVVTAVRKK